MAAYSQDLRDRIVAAYERGMKTKQIAVMFEVSPAWARRVKQRLREHGEQGIQALFRAIQLSMRPAFRQSSRVEMV